MKLSPLSSALVLVLAAATTPAFAQDARDTHFDGPYVAGVVGLGLQNNDRGDSLVFDTDGDGAFGDTVNTAPPGSVDAFSEGFCNGVARGATAAEGCRSDKSKIEYGVRVGYDKRLGGGNFVLGGLIEGSKNKSTDGTSAFSITPASYSIEREIDYAVSARLRAGFTPGGGALFYATGGGSYARIKHTFATTNGLNSFDERRDDKMVWGWQVGGGGEVMITDNVSLGLEYLYNSYKDNKYTVDVGAGTALPSNPFLQVSDGTGIRNSDRDFNFHSVRMTVGFQF